MNKTEKEKLDEFIDHIGVPVSKAQRSMIHKYVSCDLKTKVSVQRGIGSSWAQTVAWVISVLYLGEQTEKELVIFYKEQEKLNKNKRTIKRNR